MPKSGLCVAAWLVLWLGATAEAPALAMEGMPERDAMPMQAMEGAQQRPDDASLACLPCLRCPVAPAPVSQSTGNPPGSAQRSRNLFAGEVASAIQEGCAASAPAVPLRIALCRWLN